MNKAELKAYWKSEEQKANMIGWNFSYIENRFESHENDLPWNFRDVINHYKHYNDRLLDIDTGGGEFLLSLAHSNSLLSATEGFPPNVSLCKEKLSSIGIDFHECTDYGNMPFSDKQFDIVINRHGNYNIKEIFRILKPGGLFITQQVGEDNDLELITRLLPYTNKKFKGHNLKNQSDAFIQAGFKILEQNESYQPIKFYDTGALVWFAKIIEWEFIDFSVEKCFESLLSIEKEIKQNGFIKGNIHRFYLVARK